MGLLGLNDLKLKLERFCAYQERSIFEVNKKLRSYTDQEKVINSVISALMSDNFLNEERFVIAYIEGKVNQKRWGKQKVRAGLVAHHISQELIDQNLTGVSSMVYQENLLKLAQKKAKTLSGNVSSFENINKIMRFLNSKGYTSKDWENLNFKDLFSS
jgi:regulatory protein